MSRTRIIKTLGVSLILGAALIIVAIAPGPLRAADTPLSPKLLTDCVTQKQFTMHGEKNCSACAIQKKYFGSWFSRVPYVECDSNRALCDEKNIHAYPTWEDATGKQYKGAIPLATLSQLAGCTATAQTLSVPRGTPTTAASPPQLSTATPAQSYPVVPVQASILTRAAIFSALLAGFFSFFAPCLLPLYPAYFSVITGFTFAELYGLTQEHIRRRILVASLLFAGGFSLIFTLLGATGSFLGQFLFTHIYYLVQISGIVLVILGLMQLGIFTTSSSLFDYAWNIQRRMTKLGHITAVITGIAAAFSWIPCVGPLLSSILIIAARSNSVADGTLLLFIYSLGLTLPFILSGLYFPTLLDMYQEHRRLFHFMSRVAGIFLLCYGILLLTGYYQRALDMVNAGQSMLQHTISSWNMLE